MWNMKGEKKWRDKEEIKWGVRRKSGRIIGIIDREKKEDNEKDEDRQERDYKLMMKEVSSGAQ